MNLLKRIGLLLTVFTLCAATTMSAQKLGYINSLELLAAMPSAKSADSSLEAYQKQLLSEGEAKMKKFEADAAALYKKIEAGTITPADRAAQEQKLEGDRQAIIKFEQEAQQKMLKKRETLYQPVFNKANTAIQDVAKANGYTIIFDSSLGFLLHAEESDNIFSLVKSKLGI